MIPEFSKLTVQKCEVREAKAISTASGDFTVKAHMEIGFVCSKGELGVVNVEIPEGSTRATFKPLYVRQDVIQLDDCYTIENKLGAWIIQSGVVSIVKK